MSQAYQKILSQTGFSEFKALIKKWEALSDNISEKPSDVPIILPDLFLVSHSGMGRTYFLKLLAEYLSEKPNLMDFYGDLQFFEFALNYCAPNEYFSEIQRLMNEVSNAAGFRSEYRGIVYIDVDEWRGHYEEKHFLSFMEYLSDNSDAWLVVLSVSDNDPEQIKQMEALISAYVRIEKVTIEAPTVKEFSEYAESLLSAYGIVLMREAEQLLSESIAVLCDNKYFDGYKTVKMLCEDIAYEMYIKGFEKGKDLPREALAEFSHNGDYVQRMIAKIEKTKRIGFC